MSVFGELHDLQVQAAHIIDSAWHFSWHWPTCKDGNGQLTKTGWEKALKDCRELVKRNEEWNARLKDMEERILDILHSGNYLVPEE